MDVANWLHSLDLRQYEAAFLENAVTFDLLPSLTADDLKDLGVTAVGHRRRMLNAIAELQTAVAATDAPAATDAIAGSAPEERVFATAAERRQLSVMFCDVIDYTALSTRLDPEDLNAMIRNYQARVASIIARYGGFIADYLGDGVLIYFGWPDAHEANAERAVRAALAITETIGQTPVQLEPVRVRIGIATGLVVIGEPLGVGAVMHQTAIGETPNLAARLQALAPPDSIVIDAATHRQIGGLFISKGLGLVTLKGLLEPLSVWQVMSEANVESRFEALRADNMAPLIGREEELDLLLRRWRQAVRGDGQVVLVSGEPGIGKSRLIAALEERLDDEPHISLRYFSSPHHQDSALYPVISRWEHDLHFMRDEPPAEKLQKLEMALAKLRTSPEDIALIAGLLSVPVDDRYPSVNLTPQLKKERTFEALLRLLVQRARRQPLLMVFEDAHWTDASTIDLLDRVVRMLSNLPILLLVSFRPEFQPSWTSLAFVNLITLRRLTHRQAIKLAEHVVVTDTLSPAILDRIVKQTDGVPLFIEELTKAVQENVDRSDPQLHSVEVPQTLQASLVARLDKLPTAKQIAQIGAVIGRDFAHSLLAVVAKVSEAQLSAGIDALVDSGLAFRRGVGSEAVYTFKHALVRDAAYSTLLRSQRQDVHARIADTLEAEFPSLVETQPELMAHHLTQAGLTEQAIEYWRRAGLRSITKSAHAEASAHFSTALDLLKQRPAGDLRNARELDLTLNLAVPLIAVHGFGSLRVEECAMQALALSDINNDSQSRFAARRLAWNSCLMRQPVPKTLILARDLVRLAAEENDPAKVAVASRAVGYSLFMSGEFAQSDDYLTQGAALADTVPEAEFAVYGEHPSVVCRLYGGQIKLLAGYPVAGARLLAEAVEIARRGDNAHGLAWALAVAAHALRLAGQVEPAMQMASEAVKTSGLHQLPQWLAQAERSLGWALLQRGDLAQGLPMTEQGVKRWIGSAGMLHMTDCELQLAQCCLAKGAPSEARHHVNAARAHSETYGEGYLAAEIERWQAVVLQAEQAEPRLVDEHLQRSLTIARRQGARLLELRAATALARRIVGRYERGRALDVLAPVYEQFTEGFETADLREAKALLEEFT